MQNRLLEATLTMQGSPRSLEELKILDYIKPQNPNLHNIQVPPAPSYLDDGGLTTHGGPQNPSKANPQALPSSKPSTVDFGHSQNPYAVNSLQAPPATTSLDGDGFNTLGVPHNPTTASPQAPPTLSSNPTSVPYNKLQNNILPTPSASSSLDGGGLNIHGGPQIPYYAKPQALHTISSKTNNTEQNPISIFEQSPSNPKLSYARASMGDVSSSSLATYDCSSVANLRPVAIHDGRPSVVSKNPTKYATSAR
ncbi:hypothetical protein LIER_26475 [Lithospermum erythrorhizon]|uniref:Uncharacterized protein n=1 Tax=Lithospermum erythrorhizon TaxID=34254 RepID=A0AAV3R9Z5_LITER